MSAWARPSVAPPSASPTAAPVRQPRARLMSPAPAGAWVARGVAAPPAAGRWVGAPYAPPPPEEVPLPSAGNRIPARLQLGAEVAQAYLVLEVLLERGRGRVVLPLRVRREVLERRHLESLERRDYDTPATRVLGGGQH